MAIRRHAERVVMHRLPERHVGIGTKVREVRLLWHMNTLEDGDWLRGLQVVMRLLLEGTPLLDLGKRMLKLDHLPVGPFLQLNFLFF